MPKAGATVGHRLVSETIEMELDTGLINNARHGNTKAQDKIVMMFKDEYRRVHRRGLAGYFPFRDLQITVTRISEEPEGCDCECPSCDMGRHCSNTGKGCYN